MSSDNARTPSNRATLAGPPPPSGFVTRRTLRCQAGRRRGRPSPHRSDTDAGSRAPHQKGHTGSGASFRCSPTPRTGPFSALLNRARGKHPLRRTLFGGDSEPTVFLDEGFRFDSRLSARTARSRLEGYRQPRRGLTRHLTTAGIAVGPPTLTGYSPISSLSPESKRVSPCRRWAPCRIADEARHVLVISIAPIIIPPPSPTHENDGGLTSAKSRPGRLSRQRFEGKLVPIRCPSRIEPPPASFRSVKLPTGWAGGSECRGAAARLF